MLEVIYRDQHLIAINKPAGLLVHRSMVDRHETRFAVQLLRDQIGQRVYPAHRLDKGTSGVLLFALDPDSAAALGRQFEARDKHSRYLAVVRGHTAPEGLIDHPLARLADAQAGIDAAPAQAARTRYLRLACAELPFRVDRYPSTRYSLLQLEPETGRRHQLRRHLKHIAHPIIGDATYGKGRHNRFFQAHFGVSRLLLACISIELRHPAEDRPLRLAGALDEDFSRLLTALGWEAFAEGGA